jgi:hypothetical protein
MLNGTRLVRTLRHCLLQSLVQSPQRLDEPAPASRPVRAAAPRRKPGRSSRAVLPS